MAVEIPINQVKKELPAITRAYAPFLYMGLNLQSVGHTSTAEVVKNRNRAVISQSTNDKIALHAATQIADELAGRVNPDIYSWYGRKLSLYTDKESNVSFENSTVIERVKIIRDMLGVTQSSLQDEISTRKVYEKGISITTRRTKMGVELVEVIEGNSIELYVKK